MLQLVFRNDGILTWALTKGMGTAPPSFVSTSLEHQDEMTQTERDDIAYVAASMYGG